MAKYLIDYVCGHGSKTEQLFGPSAKRDSYIRWAEKTMVCPECYRAKKVEEAKKNPLKAELLKGPQGEIKGWAWAVTDGDTYSIKDALKNAGCRWGVYKIVYAETSEIKNRPDREVKAWMFILSEKTTQPTDQELKDSIIKLQECGVTVFEYDGRPLDSSKLDKKDADMAPDLASKTVEKPCLKMQK